MVAEASFVVRVPEAIYREMVAHVLAGYPDEACGALGSKGGLVVKNYPTVNAAEHPDDFSEISGPDRVRIYYDIDEYDGEMIYYHSHPRSEAYPSERDKDWGTGGGKYTSCLYIIFSLQHRPEPPYARVFKIASDGGVTEGNVEVF